LAGEWEGEKAVAKVYSAVDEMAVEMGFDAAVD
jgi:hypothetical protein